MGRLIQFGVGIAVFGFLLPVFKSVMDGFTNNSTGMLATNHLTTFEKAYWDAFPILFPVILLAMMLVMLGRRKPRDGN
jgi:hypothetical protein